MVISEGKKHSCESCDWWNNKRALLDEDSGFCWWLEESTNKDNWCINWNEAIGWTRKEE